MARTPAKRSEVAADEVRQVLGALLRRLRAESPADELSHSELAVLKRLAELGASTTAALARAELVRPQSMGATLAGLEERGLVMRTVDADDARCRNVSLTARGRSTLEEGRAARKSWLAQAIDEQLSADEQRTLVAAMALLRRVAGS